MAQCDFWDNDLIMKNTTTLKHHLGTGMLAIITLAALVVTIGMLFVTSPTSVGPGGVTLWFIGLLLSLTSVFMLIIRVRTKKYTAGVNDANQTGLIVQFRASAVLAGALVSLLALSSLRTLSMRDVLLIAGVTAVIELFFYTSDRKSA